MESNYAPHTNRLFAAADALLEAMQAPGGTHPTVVMTLGSASAKHLTSTKAFTPDELVYAMEMLIRMGFAVQPEK